MALLKPLKNKVFVIGVICFIGTIITQFACTQSKLQNLTLSLFTSLTPGFIVAWLMLIGQENENFDNETNQLKEFSSLLISVLEKIISDEDKNRNIELPLFVTASLIKFPDTFYISKKLPKFKIWQDEHKAKIIFILIKIGTKDAEGSIITGKDIMPKILEWTKELDDKIEEIVNQNDKKK